MGGQVRWDMTQSTYPGQCCEGCNSVSIPTPSTFRPASARTIWIAAPTTRINALLVQRVANEGILELWPAVVVWLATPLYTSHSTHSSKGLLSPNNVHQIWISIYLGTPTILLIDLWDLDPPIIIGFCWRSCSLNTAHDAVDGLGRSRWMLTTWNEWKSNFEHTPHTCTTLYVCGEICIMSRLSHSATRIVFPHSPAVLRIPAREHPRIGHTRPKLVSISWSWAGSTVPSRLQLLWAISHSLHLLAGNVRPVPVFYLVPVLMSAPLSIRYAFYGTVGLVLPLIFAESY